MEIWVNFPHKSQALECLVPSWWHFGEKLRYGLERFLVGKDSGHVEFTLNFQHVVQDVSSQLLPWPPASMLHFRLQPSGNIHTEQTKMGPQNFPSKSCLGHSVSSKQWQKKKKKNEDRGWDQDPEALLWETRPCSSSEECERPWDFTEKWLNTVSKLNGL